VSSPKKKRGKDKRTVGAVYQEEDRASDLLLEIAHIFAAKEIIL
jgi:hypothetical protein